MDLGDARTIGLAIWRVRDARGKSLRVVAGLAGMSKDTLQRIETGGRSPTLAEIVALANALDIAPSDLMKLPVPAPANGETDSAIEVVRLALMAVNHRQPGGQVLPVGVCGFLAKSSGFDDQVVVVSACRVDEGVMVSLGA